MGWRRGGGVEVTDRPAAGRHRAFVVDRGFRCAEQLTAFLGDYVGHAVRLAEELRAGDQVAVTGHLRSERWPGQRRLYRHTVVARDVQCAGPEEEQ